jgi:hypothetical protein
MKMPTAKKRAQKKEGPYLAAALFCENIIEGSDRVISVVRIVDQIVVTLPLNAPADVPSDEKPIPVSVWAYLNFKAGSIRGKHRLRIIMRSPSGEQKYPLDQRLPFPNEPHASANVRINIGIAVALLARNPSMTVKMQRNLLRRLSTRLRSATEAVHSLLRTMEPG